MTTKQPTIPQNFRQHARDSRTGRYEKNPCDVCGKGAPMDYFSHPSGNPALLCLCGRKRCPGTVAMDIPDIEEALAYVKARVG